MLLPRALKGEVGSLWVSVSMGWCVDHVILSTDSWFVIVPSASRELLAASASRELAGKSSKGRQGARIWIVEPDARCGLPPLVRDKRFRKSALAVRVFDSESREPHLFCD